MKEKEIKEEKHAIKNPNYQLKNTEKLKNLK